MIQGETPGFRGRTATLYFSNCKKILHYQGAFGDMILLPIETSGEGKLHALSRVQMVLGEVRQKARRDLEEPVTCNSGTLELRRLERFAVEKR